MAYEREQGAMHVRTAGLYWRRFPPSPSTPRSYPVNIAMIKNAVITSAMVLAVIYVMNQVGPTRAVVQKALQG